MRRVYIQTYGCQMNEYDSEQMLQVLATKGFEPASSPELAQLIIVNSCSVREKSENKALSMLGRWADLKKRDPSKVIALGGCVGQTEGLKLKKRFPFLDLVFGTNNYRDLPELIGPFESIWDSQGFKDQETEILLPHSKPEAKSQAFITITNGCDKFCSYCIVPFTRGREMSRTPEDIVREASSLTQKGVKEIMLLGQNVNSYWGKNAKGEFTSLYRLLCLFQEKTSKELRGLERLRYTTSHPRDFDEDLAKAFRDLPILCEYLHLPFQSGSDSILRKMRRFYTAKDYLRKIEMLRRYRPDMALSTDIIVGFPGETRQDFEATMHMIREVQFDNIYSFKYSPRPYTRSADWEDDVSEIEKSERIQELQSFQKEISQKKYEEDVGKTVELLLEGPSKFSSEFWTGRTRANRVVHLPTDASFQLGDKVFATIYAATPSWLKGILESRILGQKSFA